MACDPELVKGVELVTKAVKEDYNKNYEEALQLYDKGAEYFLHAMKFGTYSDKSKETIRVKYAAYVNRAEMIRDYLKKNKENNAQNGGDDLEGKNDETNESAGRSTSQLKKAIDLVKKAVEEDNNRNYEEALKLYDESIEYFLLANKFEAQGDKSKETLQQKCLQYIGRAEKIREYLKKDQK